MQSWFSNFKAKVASVVFCVVVCAVAAAVIRAIIVATAGVAGLAAPAGLTLEAVTFGFESVSLMAGAGVGLATETGLALDNQCLSNGGGLDFALESCGV